MRQLWVWLVFVSLAVGGVVLWRQEAQYAALQVPLDVRPPEYADTPAPNTIFIPATSTASRPATTTSDTPTVTSSTSPVVPTSTPASARRAR